VVDQRSDDRVGFVTPNRDVVVRGLEDFASLAVVGGEHAFVIDEPQEFHGTNLGPNPFSLILSALGG